MRAQRRGQMPAEGAVGHAPTVAGNAMFGISSVQQTICDTDHQKTWTAALMNYGHPLEFGTFITPGNDPASASVDLARRSEDLGFDLVTFQDHPYLPTHLDTWTLLSWVAGQTSTIRLSANVLNLPLRDPAVLARAAGQPRPPLRRSARTRCGRGRLLGRHRGHGRPTADTGRGGPRDQRGDRRHPRHSRRRRAGATTATRSAVPGRRRGAGTTAGPPRPPAARRHQTPHAASARREGGRLAGEPALPGGRRSSATATRSSMRRPRRPTVTRQTSGVCSTSPGPSLTGGAASSTARRDSGSRSCSRSWSRTASPPSSSCPTIPPLWNGSPTQVAPALARRGRPRVARAVADQRRTKHRGPASAARGHRL